MIYFLWIYQVDPSWLVAPDIATTLKLINSQLWKKKRFLASYSFRKKILFEESLPSIMVSRNLNWSTEILWYRTGYVKGKILSPLKCPAWDRLHCWFCLKLLNIYSLMLWWFVYNIHDSSASEYSILNKSNSSVGKNSTTNNSNSGVGKNLWLWKNQYIFFFYSWSWYHWISW